VPDEGEVGKEKKHHSLHLLGKGGRGEEEKRKEVLVPLAFSSGTYQVSSDERKKGERRF